MLNKNLFDKTKEEYQDMVESTFFTLAEFNDDTNIVLKVDNLEEPSGNTKHIFRAEEAIQIGSIISKNQGKNVFLINEAFNDNLKNINTSLMDNFYKLYSGFTKILTRKEETMNLTLLNMQCPLTHYENELAAALYLNSRETKNDIAMLRNLRGINIFTPADSIEARYLLKIVEKNFFKENKRNFTYFKLSSESSPNIFDKEYFEKEEGHLKEWTGLPEIIYLSKNIEAHFDVAIIASGPILYNAILAAKELEEMNYNVTVLNMSFLSSSSEYLNEKIRSFINNFTDKHTNIVTVEEHSKIGGLGSLIAEITSENKNRANVKIERMGIEDNLSARGIVAKCEEIVGY